jgi:D-alanine-D-alanine ligase
VTANLGQAGLKAHSALGCRDFSRADFILSGDGVPYLLEVNTIPGFTDHSLLPKAAAAAGIGFDELCQRIVDMALARAGR